MGCGLLQWKRRIRIGGGLSSGRGFGAEMDPWAAFNYLGEVASAENKTSALLGEMRECALDSGPLDSRPAHSLLLEAALVGGVLKFALQFDAQLFSLDTINQQADAIEREIAELIAVFQSSETQQAEGAVSSDSVPMIQELLEDA